MLLHRIPLGLLRYPHTAWLLTGRLGVRTRASRGACGKAKKGVSLQIQMTDSINMGL